MHMCMLHIHSVKGCCIVHCLPTSLPPHSLLLPPLSIPSLLPPFPSLPLSISSLLPPSPPFPSPFLPELQELVKLHGDRTHENEEPLTDDEVLIVKVTKPSSHSVLMVWLRALITFPTHMHTLECPGNAGQDGW